VASPTTSSDYISQANRQPFAQRNHSTRLERVAANPLPTSAAAKFAGGFSRPQVLHFPDTPLRSRSSACSEHLFTVPQNETAMDNHFNRGSRARDDCEDFSYDLSLAVYGTFPTPPTTPRRSRASSPTSKALPSKAAHGATNFNHCRQLIQLNRINATPAKQVSREQRMDIHQSTCLNLSIASNDSTESDLWILPDFDDWEADQEAPVASASSERESDLGTFLRRAAKSSLERLRTRLEGDGWNLRARTKRMSTTSSMSSFFCQRCGHPAKATLDLLGTTFQKCPYRYTRLTLPT
jgi:hypothetical protein